MKKILTLCMVFQDGKILLGMKKRGFGEGRWNGFGGKVEEGEGIEEGALRELREEAGIEAKEMQKVGVLEFAYENMQKVMEVHIFKVTNFSGEAVESEEMKPQWFAFGEIPFEQMWADDFHWFPYLLAGKYFKGTFLFDRPSDAEYSAKILQQELFEVEEV